MIAPEAIERFVNRQRQLVHDTYDHAWQAGVDGYEQDSDPAEPSDRAQHHAEESTLTGISLLRARAARAYVPPGSPDPARRTAALAGALSSAEAMGVELATLAPTPAHLAAAQQQAEEGSIERDAVAAAALGLAAAAWAEGNAYRLDGGESVAWAGEQAGFAESADQDGKLLQWQDEGDDRVCEDCEGLEALGPLPLSDFPTMPGDGATVCNVGCRCALEAVGTEGMGDELAPLSDTDEMTLDKVAVQAQQRLDATAPTF